MEAERIRDRTNARSKPKRCRGARAPCVTPGQTAEPVGGSTPSRFRSLARRLSLPVPNSGCVLLLDHPHPYLGLHFRMQPDRDLVDAEGLDGLVQINLALLDVHPLRF